MRLVLWAVSAACCGWSHKVQRLRLPVHVWPWAQLNAASVL